MEYKINQDDQGRPIVRAKELSQKTIEFPFEFDYQLINYNQKSKRLIIFLHGFSNDAIFMTRKFTSMISDPLFKDCAFFSLNGPFPVIEKGNNKDIQKKKWKIGFAWYLYDRGENFYYYTQDTAASFIMAALKSLHLNDIPSTVIGYSQGGYLAPFLALRQQNINHIIGINSCFKHEYLPKDLSFQIDAIHGRDDNIVEYDRSKQAHEKIISMGNRGKFISLENQHHRLTHEFVLQSMNLINEKR